MPKVTNRIKTVGEGHNKVHNSTDPSNVDGWTYPDTRGSGKSYGYGASQCGSLNNALNPTLGLKNSFIALIFRYIPLHTLGANHYYKGGNQKQVRF